jgi:hypothetical protein
MIDELYINNTRVYWLDAKASYGSLTIEQREASLHAQAIKYQQYFGPGAFVFKRGACEQLSDACGALVLDGRPLALQRTLSYIKQPCVQQLPLSKLSAVVVPRKPRRKEKIGSLIKKMSPTDAFQHDVSVGLRKSQGVTSGSNRLDATIKVQPVLRSNAAQRQAAHVVAEAVEASRVKLRQELYVAWKIKAADDLKIALQAAEIRIEDGNVVNDYVASTQLYHNLSTHNY